ncbi:MAG: hypothetical protein ABFD54_14875 [Armatimonadota bacterium]|nr:hypothetical protein [bacterium]
MSTELEQSFENPPREYAIYPIIHSAGQSEVKHPDNQMQIVDRMANLGFGGVVANVHYGTDYPDDENEWKKFRETMLSAQENDLRVWIYDEKGYPSGTAGGAVLDNHPELETIGLVAYIYWRNLSGPGFYRADIPDGKLFRALLVPLTGSGDPVDITSSADARGTLRIPIPEGTYRLFVLVERPLYDGTHSAHSFSEPRRYINLLDPKATDEFIRVTHEHYKTSIGDMFGKCVRAFFTDEPSLMNWNIENVPYPLLSWRKDFPKVFEKRYGYKIELAVVAVILGEGRDLVKRRCDFWEFTSHELAENFFGRIQDWCHANGLAASGHLLAEEGLLSHVFLYGSYFASMRRFDAPGIDQLESEPSRLMFPQGVPIARLAASVADVLGLDEVMTEASDHTSAMEARQIPIEWVRGSMNWHFAQGVNVITSYYRFAAFSDDSIRDLNRYVSRLGLMLRQGRRHSRVAVLYPECALWSACVPLATARDGEQPREAQEIERIFSAVSWGLLRSQIDFDYIDEDVISDAEIVNGRLVFGDREYEAVILPNVRVMRPEAAEGLGEFMAAGGKVLAAGVIPSVSRNGETDDRVRRIFANAMCSDANAFTLFDIDDPDIPCSILSKLPRTISLDPCNENILSHTRVDGDRAIIFLTNMSGRPYSGTMTVEGSVPYEVWNPADGSRCPVEKTEKGITVNLGAYAGLFYMAHI